MGGGKDYFEEEVIHLGSGKLKIINCVDCGTKYEENQKRRHLASIPHLLVTSTTSSLNPGFGIAEGNLGFRMLRRVGWDGRSGLGEGKRGRLFPVKTSLRQSRVGLAEGDKKGAR